MGYLFQSDLRTRKDAVNAILLEAGENVLGHSVRGNQLYVAYRSNENPELVTILVFLLAQHQGNFGYKAMDETMFPYYFNCPEKILKLSTNPEGEKWRNACRKVRQDFVLQKNLVTELPQGHTVQLENHGEVTFLYCYNKSKTQFVGRNSEGKVYRYNTSSIIIPTINNQ